MKRIIAVQGSMPLLNSLSVLGHQRRMGTVPESQDFLLIGGLYTKDTIGIEKTAAICEQMARIWPFKKIYFLQNLEVLLSEGVLSFDQAVMTLRAELGFDEVDINYVGRNWQLFNELVLNAFPAKQVIAYGDSLGILDIDQPQFGRVFAPAGLKPVDAAYLITPIEGSEGALKRCPVHQVDPFDFALVVAKVARHIDGFQKFCHELSTRLKGKGTLLITAYDTDASLSRSFDDEISAYCELVRREVKSGSPVLVKGHPRQASQQAEELVRRLNAMGHLTFSLTQYNQVPVEVFSSWLPIENVLACNSYAAISLAYLNQCAITLSFGEHLMRKSIRPEWQQELCGGERVRVIGIEQAYRKQFEPIYYNQWKHSKVSPSQEPIHYPSQSQQGVSPIEQAKQSIGVLMETIPARGQVIIWVPSKLICALKRRLHPVVHLCKRIGKRLYRCVA